MKLRAQSPYMPIYIRINKVYPRVKTGRTTLMHRPQNQREELWFLWFRLVHLANEDFSLVNKRNTITLLLESLPWIPCLINGWTIEMNVFYGTLVLVSFPLLIRSDFDFGLQKDKKPKVNRKKKTWKSKSVCHGDRRLCPSIMTNDMDLVKIYISIQFLLK